jgi:hypothetical protein
MIISVKQQLQGDISLQLSVFGKVYLAGAARTYRFDNPIMRNCITGG